MLIRFSVENYKSIKNHVFLDMIRFDDDIPAVSGNNINYLQQEIDGKNVHVCPIMAIFGANASGKSNILKALITMRQLIMNGETANFYTPFLFSKDTENAPIKLKILFSKDNVIYDYEIIFDNKEIHHECLKKQEKGEDACVFDTHNEATIPSEAWQPHILHRKTMLACLNSIDYQNKEDISLDLKRVMSFFKEDIIVADEINSLPIDMNNINIVKNRLMDMDLNFNDIECERVCIDYLEQNEDTVDTENIKQNRDKIEKENPNCLISFDFNKNSSIFKGAKNEAYRINMVYRKDDKTDVKMNLMSDESTGTRNLFNFVLFLTDALENGKIIAFDEIDRTIHTELIRYIFKIVTAASLNEHNAQLICSSHNPCLMSNLDNSEILIVNKNKDLSTEAIRLSEYKISNEKNRLDIVYDYLIGKFKGIPNVVNIFEETEL